MSRSKNDIAWEQLFEKHNFLEKISEKGYAEISSAEINKIREARLMTKFDHKSQLPKLFSNNRLSILPTSRGGYIIGGFETFCDFNQDEPEIIQVNFPTSLESLDYRDITSEATAINCAFVSEILHAFTNEEKLYPTVSGRMSSSSFDFKINSKKGLFGVRVENSQVEIDGGYEGDNSLYLIEAKNYISDDFLIRQLYYPYKLWKNKISKKICPIFLTYSNGVFHLREYGFSGPEHYNSLQLIKHKKYVIQDNVLNVELIQKLLDSVRIVREPNIPFPQADSFDRVINLCELLKNRECMTKEEITDNYDFNYRQANYYSSAGEYLELIETKRINNQTACFLTREAKRIFNQTICERQIEFVKLILSHNVFNNTLKTYFEKGEMPTKNEIVEIMKKSNLYRINSDETYFRRASTISGWIYWIINQIEE